ncbi:MAG TPA: PAS domain S-box protein, partial [Prolixibacteraceae bacterium]|nr:PAS domain S-box protein [Prolixibacteraceae bacterium]
MNGYFRRERIKVINQAKDELNAIAILKIDQLSEWYADELNDASVISQNIFLIRDIVRWIEKPSGNNSTELREKLNNIRQEHGFFSVLLFTPDLQQRISSDSETPGMDIFHPQILKQIQVDRKPKSSGLYLCDKEQRVYIDFFAPVFMDLAQDPVAFICFRHDPDQNLFPAIQKWPVASRTAETLLVRKEKDHALFLNNLRHQDETAMKLKISFQEKDVPAIHAVLGNVGFFEGVDYRGEDVLAYTDSIPGTPWYMVAKIDRSELMEEIFFNSRNQWIFSLLLLLFVSGIFLFLYAWGQKNFYKKLYETRETYRTTLYSIGDAVITSDREGRVVHMNPVAERLTGWTEKEAIQQQIDEVFAIFNEETGESVPNPVKRVIREGEVVGLANHTVLLSKDGRRIPIADSGAPIFDNNRSITGVVLV